MKEAPGLGLLLRFLFFWLSILDITSIGPRTFRGAEWSHGLEMQGEEGFMVISWHSREHNRSFRKEGTSKLQFEVTDRWADRWYLIATSWPTAGCTDPNRILYHTIFILAAAGARVAPRGQDDIVRKGEIRAHLTVEPRLSSDASGGEGGSYITPAFQNYWSCATHLLRLAKLHIRLAVWSCPASIFPF